MAYLKQKIKEKLPYQLVALLKCCLAINKKAKSYYQRLKRLKEYAGNAVECPFCKRTFSRFRQTGVLNRSFWKTSEALELLKLDFINVANALCPWCGSGERHRALYFYLYEKLKIMEMKSFRLLDVAPDNFITKEFFSDTSFDYISVDLISDRKPSFVMDVTKMDFADCHFEGIICYHVLEHIPNDRDAISELYRVLKHSGWALIQVPIWAKKTVEDASITTNQYLQFYGHAGHVRRCGPDYKERIEAAGFRVVEDDFIGRLPGEKICRFGLFETEKIWFCEKV